MQSPILMMTGIKKRFKATQALDGVNFEVLPNEVHVLLGENGAGKSTLMKVLSGVYQSDEGEVFWKGEKVDIKDPKLSLGLGIGMVYQELSVVREMSVFENVKLGALPKKASGFVDWKTAIRDVQEWFDELELDIDVRKPLKFYDLGVQQLVEISRAVSRNNSLIILDEPTSALTESEVNILFNTIRKLKAQGVSFIYITHRLDEVFQIGDRVTILRDGKTIKANIPIDELTEEKMVYMMVGREIKDHFPKVCNKTDDPLLEVNEFGDNRFFNNVSFTLHKGEVLGIAGLVGAGRSELAEALFGLRKYKTGTMALEGKSFVPVNPRNAISHRLGLITKDRRKGLLLHMSVAANVAIATLQGFSKFGFRLEKKEFETASHYVEELKIDTRNTRLPVNNLSGGNQQKVAVAKWYCNQSNIFIMDDPTRGVDVGAKVEMYRMINNITESGAGVIMISSEMPELLGMSDTIMVMRRGEVVARFDAKGCTQEAILEKAAGGDSQDKTEKATATGGN